MNKETLKYLLNLLFLVIIATTQTSCSENPEPGFHPSKLEKITIESSNGDRLDVIGSETFTLTATGSGEDGYPIDISGKLEWSANNNNVSVDYDGKNSAVITAVKVGSTTVTVTSDDITADFVVNVWDSSAPRTEIFISDAGNYDKPPWQILRTDDEGGYIEIFTDKNLDWPQDIVVLEDQGIAIISNLNSGKITKYDLNSGDYEGVFASNIGGPTRMMIGDDDLLYVLQWHDGLVERYKQDGTFVDSFTDVEVDQSIGMAWDMDGNLYVSSYSDGNGGGYVRKFDSSGNDLGIFISSNLQGPTNIWFEGNSLIVYDYPQGKAKRFNSNGEYVDDFITGLNLPEGIDHLMNGNILVGNGGTSTIKIYSGSGTFIKDLIPSGTLDLLLPNAVIVREVNR